MKKFAALLLTLLMTVSLAACAGDSEPSETGSPDVESSVSEKTSEPESNAAESQPETKAAQSGETEGTESVHEAKGAKVLAAYFSATNTTEGVAEHIANGLNADLYEIVPEEPYTEADLNYNDDNSRSTIEMNDPSARPAISGSVENMEQYDIVFIGYPIWWGEAPRIVSTFIESYDFSGKTIVPFCTSGGSGIGSSASNLEQLTSGADWLEGRRLNGSDSEETVMEWVNGLGLDVSAE
ncbi:flavodoxin [Lachnospiraceae bacterium]|jgi:flavodoxin|nr:flavodoxin [uncultured Schaedlerella sp.]NBI58434.1 flavodoxin [Lachnospiraceae bacterium]